LWVDINPEETISMSTLSVKSGLLSSIDLEVEDTGGTGRPVVLIHGWPLSHEAWADQAPALTAAGYRVISYDRRGFGNSEKPGSGYDYDSLTKDLDGLLEELDLQDVTLVGFSMGGGEVVRYVAKHGEERLRSVVLASAVPPFMLKSDDNPDGAISQDEADQMAGQLDQDRDAFFDTFTTQFFSANGELKVTEQQRQEAVALCLQSDQVAALKCMESFGGTDFRDDLAAITGPTLVIHGDGDGTVPFEASGRRTNQAVPQSELHVVSGGPHGINVSHAEEFNQVLLAFLQR